GNAATPIDTSIVLTDADAPATGDQIANARIQVTTGFVLGQDLLGNGSLTGTGVTAAVDPASGALSLTGGASLAVYQTILRAVTGLYSTTLNCARVPSTANYLNGHDLLDVSGTLPSGITAAFDTSSGALTLTGPSTVANFTTALRQATFVNTNPATSANTRTI